MKILALCNFGQNRSRFLAEYLAKKGYETDYGGVDNDHDEIQKKIDAADIIITVHATIFEKLKSNFVVTGKKIVELDVEDRPQVILCSTKPLEGDAWYEFQRQHVFSKLIEQIDKYF